MRGMAYVSQRSDNFRHYLHSPGNPSAVKFETTFSVIAIVISYHEYMVMCIIYNLKDLIYDPG